MNALVNIENEARVIVEQLADKEVNRMEDLHNGFTTWMNEPGNALIGKWDDKIDTYGSVAKYVYMTKYDQWDRELGKYVLPTEYPTSYRDQQQMFYNKSLANMVAEIRLVNQGGLKRYREEFINANMFKLNRALAKHLTNEMTASDIKISVGGDGAEVTARIGDMLFRTFGTLCGGYIQCYHYRYRSSLK